MVKKPRTMCRCLVAAAVLVVCAIAATASMAAQQPVAPPAPAEQRGAAAGGAERPPATNVQELQRLFDAYVVIRAQDALKLDDEKFTAFLPKLKALQDVRRRGEQAHNQLVALLNKLTAPSTPFDEAKAREAIKAMQDVDAHTAAEVRKAFDAVDSMLDVFQQARFRIFEVQMERRKIDLLLQARKADAARAKDGEAAPVKKVPMP